jgi:hypothetical protein
LGLFGLRVTLFTEQRQSRHVEGEDVPRRERQRLFDQVEAALGLAHAQERVPLERHGAGQLRLDGERGVQVGDRFFVLAGLEADPAAPEIGAGVGGAKLDGPVQIGQRQAKAAKHAKRPRAVDIECRLGGLQVDGARERLQCLIVVRETQGGPAQVSLGDVVVGLQRRDLSEIRQRFRGPAQLQIKVRAAQTKRSVIRCQLDGTLEIF